MSKMKMFGYGIGAIISLILLSFLLHTMEIVHLEVFGVKKADVKREIFEQSKSYTHGMAMDLAKYYDEYRDKETTDEDKNVIRNIIKQRFANFDASNVTNVTLRNFLIKQRGY